MTTLADIRSRVRLHLQEPDPLGRFGDDVLDIYINDALKRIADETEVLVEDKVSDVDAGVSSITLPTDTLGVKLVRWNNVRLLQATQEYLDTLADDWITLEGTPRRYFTNVPNVVRLVPIPNENGQARIRYTRTPALLVDDDDASELPDFLSDLAPFLATAEALLSETEGGAQKASPWFARYESKLALAMRRLATRQTVPEGFRIRTERRR